jgi:transposase-like protein
MDYGGWFQIEEPARQRDQLRPTLRPRSVKMRNDSTKNAAGLVVTTNAIEALNSKLRRAARARGHFPSDEAATKLLFLVLNQYEKEWIMPPREWAMAKAQFAVLFGERFTRAMA